MARLADGGFVTTRMIDRTGLPLRAEGRLAELVGTITGSVFEWHPGGQLQPVADTELSMPNGIEVSADGRYLYVAATGTQELVRFDRRSTPVVKRVVRLPMRPDNIRWNDEGKLLIAAFCEMPDCALSWSVIEVDPETLALSHVAGADGPAAMLRASAAIKVGNEIWVANNEDRIARLPLN